MSTNPAVNAFNSNGASPGGNTITIPNMDAVESKVFHAPPGTYPARVISFIQNKSQAGNSQVVFEFEVDCGAGKTLKRRFYCPLSTSSLWKLKRTCGALGIPEGAIDVNKVIGSPCMVNLQDGEPYNGSPTSDIGSCDPMPASTTGLSTDPSNSIPF